MDLAREGATKAELYDQIENFMVWQRGQPDFHDQDEDAIVDLLDALTGNCHPSAQLLP